MFGVQTDVLEFDFDDVEELQESKSLAWAREREQIEVGVITRNRWRNEQGMKSLPWGDAWWAPLRRWRLSRMLSRLRRQNL